MRKDIQVPHKDFTKYVKKLVDKGLSEEQVISKVISKWSFYRTARDAYTQAKKRVQKWYPRAKALPKGVAPKINAGSNKMLLKSKEARQKRLEDEAKGDFKDPLEYGYTEAIARNIRSRRARDNDQKEGTTKELSEYDFGGQVALLAKQKKNNN